jgi:hypothetical protein
MHETENSFGEIDKKINKKDTKLSRDPYFPLFSQQKESVFKENKVLFNTKKIYRQKKILHKNKNLQTPIKCRQNKTKKELTIDTMGNTENTVEISFFFSAIFHSLATEWKKLESSSPLCRLSCFTFIVSENDVA